MKVILMNVPGHGHVNPTLAVVRGLVEENVEVLYYNTKEFDAQITATGAEFRPYPLTTLTADAIAQGARRHLVDVTQILFEASLTLTEFMVEEIAREEPDLLIFDSIALWGAQAARLSGLPAVASITTFILEGAQIQSDWRDKMHMVGGALWRLPRLLKARRALVQRYGRSSLPETYVFPCTGHLNLVYTIRELQPPTPVIDGTFRFVGPSLTLPPSDTSMPLSQLLSEPLSDERIIYISLGTIHTGNRDFFEICFEAFAHEPGSYILSAGAQAAQLSAPDNFIVRAHVPQLEILQHADLFITHAGINSLHESLYLGVPMVMVPQQIEQVMNARIGQMNNVGIVLGDQPPYGQKVNAAMLRDAAQHVLGDPKYGEAVQHMQGLLQTTPGAAGAVNAIMAFAAVAESPRCPEGVR